MCFFEIFIDFTVKILYNITMKNKVIKAKHRRFSMGGGNIEIIDWGYNDFRYIEPITTPRYLNNYSLHFVVKGSGTLNYGKNTYKISGKNIFRLTPDELISYYPEKNEPWRYFWINFKGDESAELINAMGFTNTVSVKKAETCEMVYATFENLLTSSCSQKEFYYKIKALLYDTVACLCEDKNTETFIKSSDIVTRVKEILLINYKNPTFSVEALADILHVSHSYVCRLFKEVTGVTVIKYLVKLRLEKACEMLNEKDYLVKDLARQVGFNDELHFMKEFKKQYGVTVKNYAKNRGDK